MASCDPFTTGFSGSADQLFAKLSKLVHDNGGRITGNASAGTVSISTPIGAVDASYQVSGQDVTIHVTKRPFFLPCSTIESFVKEHLPSVEGTDIAHL